MESEATYQAVRRSYELGRLRKALVHALVVAGAVGALSSCIVGPRSLVWLPLTLVTVLFTEWRGMFTMFGARRGLVAGAAAMLLPLSLLRPCCIGKADMDPATCCTMPSACWGAGMLVGLVMALVMPRAPEGQRSQAAFGMIAGLTSVAVLRCSMLFVGEALGLLGGMAAGVIATSLARLWLTPKTA